MFDAGATSEASPLGSADVVTRLADLVVAAGAMVSSARASEGWPAGDRRGALASVDRLAGILATLRAGLLAAEERAQTSLGPGDRDFVAARARLARTGLGDARREVRQARALGALPLVADAVASGRVPIPHLDALARATADVGAAAEQALAAPDGQARLVQLAERLSVREFSGAVARMVAEHEPDALERSVQAQRDARFLTVSTQPDGVFLRGRLDRLAGAVLRLALDGVGVAPDETRDKPQADADALVALAERATTGMAGVRTRRVDQHGAPIPDDSQDAADARVSGTANRPVLSVLVPADTFAEALARRRHERAVVAAVAPGVVGPDAVGPGVVGPGVVGPGVVARAAVSPATLDDGSPLAMSQLAALLCDSELGRVVLDADSVPLDLGRTTRLFTAAQRRAVIVRDRACAWNGCDVPSAYCEVHHIRWWDRDRGPTDLANAVLLCSHHHHVVHRFDLGITRVAAPAAALGAALPGPRPPRGTIPLAGRCTVPWEPVRYRFVAADGRVVNAPSTARATAPQTAHPLPTLAGAAPAGATPSVRTGVPGGAPPPVGIERAISAGPAAGSGETVPPGTAAAPERVAPTEGVASPGDVASPVPATPPGSTALPGHVSRSSRTGRSTLELATPGSRHERTP